MQQQLVLLHHPILHSRFQEAILQVASTLPRENCADTEIGAEVNALLEVVKRIDSVSADLYCVSELLLSISHYLLPWYNLEGGGDEKMLAQLEDLSGTLRCRLSIVHHLQDCDKEVYVFTQDLKMALDRFRTAALPMYTTSTIEMMVLCLGIKEEFSHFLNAITALALSKAYNSIETIAPDTLGSTNSSS
ncbi:hypothetical protein BS47DRAFT_1409034 [Hydnum rufescens UP504]|uniref:Uncharacterized protein n=1 Tax=Hydnum rufescens UP504 TaxID=1448309 RepID=A0A9P6AR10_9AGAM|nr:hypothetical protein BS47DRAFT_1409034 [Hydnum rufescens UP504]